MQRQQPSKAAPRSARDLQSGVVAVWVLIVAIPMMIAVAMALNMGILMDTRTELQGASDAAALAGARSLNGTAAGIGRARTAAINYSKEHTAYGQSIAIVAADVQFGRWKTKNCVDCFEPLDLAKVEQITAVKVSNGRDEAHGTALALPFGGLFGMKTANMRSGAVAIGGGPGPANVDCPLPLGIAECTVTTNQQLTMCGDGPHRFVFSNEHEDAVGFVNLYGGVANGTTAADIIRDGCRQAGIGSAQVQNGNDAGKVIDALRGAPKNGGGQGGGQPGPCLLGTPQTLPVVRLGCPPAFRDHGNDGAPVVGFVKATITELTDNNGDVMTCVGTPPGPKRTPHKNSLVIEISCDPPAPAGGAVGGPVPAGARLRLVQ